MINSRGMADAEEHGIKVLKRQRTTQACEKCRSMKAKCDGSRPCCSRCSGYGYSCSYSASRSRRQKLNSGPQQSESSPRLSDLPANSPISLLHGYDEALGKIRAVLPDSEKSDMDIALSSIKARLVAALSPSAGTVPTCQVRLAPSPTHSSRYLGEVSDVRFFNLVRRVVCAHGPSDGGDEPMDSYDQDDPIPQRLTGEISLTLPNPEIAESYIEIYFSTIHIAYPFIPKSTFIREYKKFREAGVFEDVQISWLALLYIVFAIGAYYTSFPAKEASAEALHERYFRQALALSNPEVFERSAINVSFLLAQCFYLLTVCKTDRCWTTLGIAVRIGQSIGLHVESEDPQKINDHALLRLERRRRLWYSIYVLDRLLALQLGRPPAIHDDDCHMSLPSRIDDAEFDWDTDVYPVAADGTASIGDYFLCVIEFSSIVGSVLRGLYGPKRDQRDELVSTRKLDKQLLDWKRRLPRALKFDIGHTFEKSILFKRQRNMLAIKFHHLRALIHRPYLCLPFLHAQDHGPVNSLRDEELHEVSGNEKICITEAQETAHLLHNVIDEKDLVHNFPWWQMISCLICASSILLVASLFTALNRLEGAVEASALDEDAETCLKVFEALGANSDGARMARDMMQRLRDYRIRPGRPPQYSVQPLGSVAVHENGHPIYANIDAPMVLSDESIDRGIECTVDSVSECLFAAQEWPSEIWDSMTWSAQFFEAAQNPQGSV